MLASNVDIAILTTDPDRIPSRVLDAVKNQTGIRAKVRFIDGTPQPRERLRWETIVRARNQAVQSSTSDWLMFLDDDVQLQSDTVARLYHGLQARPEYGALAADYLGDRARRRPSPHVGMGATMFRRSVIADLPFRFEADRCECLCLCHDLRARGIRIDYAFDATARHLERSVEACSASVAAGPIVRSSLPDQLSVQNSGVVLAAFNRRDVGKFQRQFLHSLRQSGNAEQVIAVVYGLRPSERNRLASLPGVSVVAKRDNGVSPPIRRLSDFADIVRSLPSTTPVAYWDAGDVVFQGRLTDLWATAAQHPDRVLAGREPQDWDINEGMIKWTRSIANPVQRDRAVRLLSGKCVLNSGFAAGNAIVMLDYFSEAKRLRESEELRGTLDWGDQTALNLYCHSDVSRWKEVQEGWNFCVYGRTPGSVRVNGTGRVSCSGYDDIRVVHGNARSLDKLAIRW